MAIKNGTLNVPSFDPTANPGEYTITGAIINSVTCLNGTADLQVGWVLWSQATDPNSGTPISGVSHRYRMTEVTPTSFDHVDLKVIWDEGGSEQDSPTNGSYVAFSEVTQVNLYGLPPSDLIYTELPLGLTTSALLINTQQSDPKMDKTLIFPQNLPSNHWVINHQFNKQPSVFVEDLDGNDIDCSVTYPTGPTANSQVILDFLEPIAGVARLN